MKADLDRSLQESGLQVRGPHEKIATPVPTWSIETWLLALLGVAGLDEHESRKVEFERKYPGRVAIAIRNAAQAWRDNSTRVPSLPSLSDGTVELDRILDE
jgi:hypothetical protein